MNVEGKHNDENEEQEHGKLKTVTQQLEIQTQNVEQQQFIHDSPTDPSVSPSPVESLTSPTLIDLLSPYRPAPSSHYFRSHATDSVDLPVSNGHVHTISDVASPLSAYTLEQIASEEYSPIPLSPLPIIQPLQHIQQPTQHETQNNTETNSEETQSGKSGCDRPLCGTADCFSCLLPNCFLCVLLLCCF